MDALTFLYWSLGVGFAVLVVFLVIALIYLIKILKDFSETSSFVRETVEKVNDNVAKVTDKVTEVTEQIAEYVIKPVTVIQFIMEKAKPVLEMLQKKGEEWGGVVQAEAEEEPVKKKKSHFRRSK